ncbi:hypothetical protein LguiA_013006 [Lonicera macranthoides]
MKEVVGPSSVIRKPRICFGCGQLGHLRKECPFRKPKLASVEKSGGSRISSSLPVSRGQALSQLLIRPPEVKCSVCRRMGHTQYSCSLWRDIKNQQEDPTEHVVHVCIYIVSTWHLEDISWQVRSFLMAYSVKIISSENYIALLVLKLEISRLAETWLDPLLKTFNIQLIKVICLHNYDGLWGNVISIYEMELDMGDRIRHDEIHMSERVYSDSRIEVHPRVVNRCLLNRPRILAGKNPGTRGIEMQWPSKNRSNASSRLAKDEIHCENECDVCYCDHTYGLDMIGRASGSSR